jgi:CheY-like chemotaxis protein
VDIEPGDYISIAVADSGTGMAPGVIARAFDPFFTTKAIGQGTGLGLSMIYGFVRQSGGDVKIDSSIDRGTSIRLFLPRHKGRIQVQDTKPDLSDEHISNEGEVVVVIDDEPVVRGLIVDVLEELGYRALEAADGPSGLALINATQHIDLLVTDIGLPGLNGRQVADAARSHRPGLKVLFMTGYADAAVAAKGFMETGMSMITKPFAMEDLASRIRRIIEND